MESAGGRNLATVAAAQTYQRTFLQMLNCSIPDVCILCLFAFDFE